MLIAILILCFLSLILFSLHLGGARHRTGFLVSGSFLLIAALAAVPIYVNMRAESGSAPPLTLPDIIEFYGTVLGLFSSCVLGYVAFRISRNDHKRHNSSCVSISSVQCRPLFVADKSFAQIHNDPSHRRQRFADLSAAWEAFRSAAPTDETPSDYEPQQPESALSKNRLFNYNVQSFKVQGESGPLTEVGKLSNELDVRLSHREQRRKQHLNKTVTRLKRFKKVGAFRRARLVFAERRLQQYQDYTTLPDTSKHNVLAFCISNQGPSALQQVIITFPRNNYRFACFVSFPEGTSKCKYISIPDDCRQDDVLCITFVSCYNERTYGEFKLNAVKHRAPFAEGLENADKAQIEAAQKRIYYTVKHFHYYGTQKQ